MKYVIVGGVAGGASAAARLRRMDEEAEIVLFERGEYISYANCGLPYYIGDVITERDKLFVQTPEKFGQRFRVDVRVLSEVLSIDTQKKELTVNDLTTGREYNEPYDKLILSPGAEPVKPPLPGIDSKGIFTLRNVVDTDRIKAYVNEHHVKSVVVVGAGFIGLEMAENLCHLGMRVSIVEMADQVMTPIDYEMASLVHEHIKSKGVQLFLKEAVESFTSDDNGITVHLRDDKSLRAELVILSIGVRPEVSLARGAGLKIGVTGGIFVNEYLQTSDPAIYAVGDAIEFVNPISGKPSLCYLAGPANKQARICADNVALGNKRVYRGAIGTAVAKVFDMTVATTGLSSHLLDRLAIPYETIIIHMASHAGYYPGAIPMSVKINFSKTDGLLLGAQVVGYDGCDKRVDMMAEVIRQKGTVMDLTEVEHAYAPPFSSAKDPVNMVGFAADNILSGMVVPIRWNEFNELDKSEYTLLDVRTEVEHSLGFIPGSLNITLDDLRERMGEIPKDKKVVIYCAVGLRGYIAARILMQYGFTQVLNLTGGYKTYAAVMQEQSSSFCQTPTVSASVVADKETKVTETLRIDACGLQCPGPVMKLKTGIEKIADGERMLITATDNGFKRDVASWAKMTGNKLLSVDNECGLITAVIEKSSQPAVKPDTARGDGKTLIVFSDDLDKALASFVIANGAASTGKHVTMFFTFWGLSVIKKQQHEAVKKDILGKMFGMMLPRHSKKLSLSKINMFGLGAKMMRFVMKKKKIESLEMLIHDAQASGIEFIACQMSMDVMGVKAEELMDGVTIGGVASYLERAEESNVNLFI